MKLAIITGASAGIGAATAARFVAGGHAVVAIARRPCPVPGVDSIRCDIADDAALAAAGAALAARVRATASTCVVHNAALLAGDRAGHVGSDALRRVLGVNVVAANALNNLLLPAMKPGSSVLYVGSTLSEKAVPGTFSYVVSKHALLGMMRATCQDLAGRGIHTALVCPGFTDTEMLRQHLGDDPATRAAIAAMNAAGRLVEPAEIAEVLWFAAANPVLNGAVLHANLGQVER